MSSDPQWKSFQPSTMDSDTAILDFKTLSISSPNGSPYNNGANGSSNHGHYNHYPQNYGSSGGSSFPIGTFTGREGNDGSFNGDNNTNSSSNSNSFNQSQPRERERERERDQREPQQSQQQQQQNNSDGAYQSATRETGIIEKLLHSYGFIQCCERQARLFFHFSQFSGNIEHLKIGDPVEFEMTYDRRTGKPIASFITKIAPEVVLSEERVTGNVTTEIRSDGQGGETQGRISYENRGECFFLPYNKDDVEGNVTLRSGDKVSFQIAANPRGNLGASHVRLENPAHPVRYQGVVCSMKESFGFIERADVVKEIFFHFSESKNKEEIRLGDDVEFTIQTRNGKEVACNITVLPRGSIIFEDVNDEIMKGQVLKPLERGQNVRHQNDPLPGRIKYRAADHSESEVAFGDKDQKGDFTLKHGDWVSFRLAIDRRDGLKRATDISLLDESFNVSGERREQGVVTAVKDGYGFLRCVEREPKLFFHFSEVLNVDKDVSVGDEVEFTMIQDQASSFSHMRQRAIRIKHLSPHTVKFENVMEQNVSGSVTKDVLPGYWNQRSPSKNQSNDKTDPGTITYTVNDGKKTISYSLKDCDHKCLPKVGDQVEFDIAQVKRNKELVAINVRVSQRAASGDRGDGQLHQGYIAALKDGYGFIENLAHDMEVFFHFSNLDGDANKLELGFEVEFTLNIRGTSGTCMSAENVKVLPKGTLKAPTVLPDVLDGKVVRPLRSVNPEQDQYAGLIEASTETEGEKGAEYEFGITSLTNKRELLQVGDPVNFQVDSQGRAANVAAIRKKRRATVDSVKGLFGFLAYEVEEGKKLFFHMSEVKENATLQAGDTVDFVLVTNHRTGKSSACNVTKVCENTQRPERLISRLRTTSVDDTGPKLTVLRQPKGPDGTKGFTIVRVPRLPGVGVE
ncbi:cold shock domain-containing protein E1 isoform X1 [Frankliniella occidentalis]|uniref:Cold shock domain-containing protein E1 isoform X1 n=1 Tax=Frankliniella occidentalis TaxID=133901 RepID=A0A6J1STP7_FRAOC|nr:cold shock domain-containing protein E1 isoform X1 [Frankliniella occidentalis]XP_026284242.1 cold shock domain-containing protein E1 isoform X1 [Frankliniella occidentalis]XP_026284247.1 cold shock domain-containing protein E1 isoform X1 [Frankliniella occidentalis]